MKVESFKKAWGPDEYMRWTEFDPDELAKTNLSDQTKSFLAQGFPEDAAPFLNFGLRSLDWKFYNMENFIPYSSHQQLGSVARHFWIFGSDGSGNPICLDSGNQDRVVLLDHECGFEIMDTMNQNITELFKSLLAYKNFITSINNEFGEDGFFDTKYNATHIQALKDTLIEINPRIFEESSFWEQEIDMLFSEIES